MAEIGELREKIDSIDHQILQLLNERARTAMRVGSLKKQIDGSSAVIYRPEREAQILSRMITHNKGPLNNESICKLYRNIISSCRQTESDLTVAVLGPVGTFTELAAMKHFGQQVILTFEKSIGSVFESVKNAEVDYGVVAIENSQNGPVEETFSEFAKNTDIRIISEIYLPVEFCLAAQDDDLCAVSIIAGHPQALGQCRLWIEGNMRHADLRPVASNALAGRMAAGDPEVAALLSRHAANMYGLKVLAKNVEEDSTNKTRFVVISRNQYVEPTGADKTTILVSGRKGSNEFRQWLADEEKQKSPIARNLSVSELSKHDILCVEVEGHEKSGMANQLITEITNSVSDVKLLGSYPVAFD